MSPAVRRANGDPEVAELAEALLIEENVQPARPCSQLPSLSGSGDPLGDVIGWLDSADLGEELFLGEAVAKQRSVSCRSQDSREIIAFNDGEGMASPTIRSGVRNEVPSGGIQQMPSSRMPQLKAPDAGIGSSEKSDKLDIKDCCCIRKSATTTPVGSGESRNLFSGHGDEDEEWEVRQKQTGAAGRLVSYDLGERPMEDIMLRGGNGRRIMVTAVCDDGKADRAGVKAGDVLVSINGRKDFMKYSADYVHATYLVAPVLLVFLGFVGKLQAEVRLNYKGETAGISMQENVMASRPDASVQVLEEVVFQNTAKSPLFLSTDVLPKGMSKALVPHPVEVPQVDADVDSDSSVDGSNFIDKTIADLVTSQENIDSHTTCQAQSTMPTNAVYELHSTEAKHLVQNVLARVKATVPQRSFQTGLRVPNASSGDEPLASTEVDICSNLHPSNASPSPSGDGSTPQFLNAYPYPPVPMKPSDPVGIIEPEPPQRLPRAIDPPLEYDDECDDLIPIYKPLGEELLAEDDESNDGDSSTQL